MLLLIYPHGDCNYHMVAWPHQDDLFICGHQSEGMLLADAIITMGMGLYTDHLFIVSYSAIHHWETGHAGSGTAVRIQELGFLWGKLHVTCSHVEQDLGLFACFQKTKQLQEPGI